MVILTYEIYVKPREPAAAGWGADRDGSWKALLHRTPLTHKCKRNKKMIKIRQSPFYKLIREKIINGC